MTAERHLPGRAGRPSSASIVLAMAFLILVWSLNYIVAKIVLRELPALALGSFRLATAGTASLPVLFFSRKREHQAVKVTVEVPLNRSTPISKLWTITYLGFFGVILNQGCFTVGLNYTSVSHSSLIIGCAPVLILLFSWALHLETLTRRKAIGMVLSFAGAAVVAVEQATNAAGSPRGDLLTLLAGIGLALYTVLGKRVIAEYSPMRLSLLTNIAAAVLVSPAAIWQVAVLAHVNRLGAISLEAWGGVIYLGVLGSAVSYILYFWALRYLSPTRLGAVSYLQPIGAILLGLVLLGEAITRRVAVGGLLIVAGVYAVETHPHELEPEEELA